MAWNKDLPADASKLRLSAGYIRANWTGIENGDVPYVYLRLAEQVVDPTRLNDRGWLFAKQDDSQTELFYMDDRNPAKVTQLVQNQRLGIPTQGVNASNLIMDSTSFAYAKNQMITAMGHVTSGGNLSFGVNIDSAALLVNPGQYTIDVTADALLTSNYLVIVTGNRVGVGNTRVPMVVSKPAPVVATATTIQIQMVAPNSDNDTNSSFDVIIIGGR